MPDTRPKRNITVSFTDILPEKKNMWFIGLLVYWFIGVEVEPRKNPGSAPVTALMKLLIVGI